MVSNKTLASLLVVAIVLSLSGTLVSINRLSVISGFATSDALGNVSLQINSTVSLRMSAGTSNISFGSGVVSSNPCTLDTDDGTTIGCDGFTAQDQGFIVYNDGNTPLTVTLDVNQNSSSLIGGTSPAFQIKAVANLSESSCANNLEATTWTDIIANTSMSICNSTGLEAGASEDALEIDIKLVIPDDAPGTGGSRQAFFTFTGDET